MNRAARSARSIRTSKPTRKHEYTFGIDRELGARMSFGMRYVHKGWDETIDDIGVCEPGSQVCGEVYNIANPGKGIGKTPIDGTAPTVPEVVNVYDGLEFVVRKRYSNNWQGTRAFCSAGSMATTAVWRARTRTAASRRTSAATTTRCSCRSTRRATKRSAG